MFVKLKAWSRLAILCSLLVSTPALAQDEPVEPVEEESSQEIEAPLFDVYLGVLVGPHVKIKSWDLHETSEQGYTPAAAWPQVGLRFGGTLFAFVSLDAELSYLTYMPEQGARNHALSYRAGALAQLFPNKTWTPFATAGVGAYHNISGANGTDVDMRTDYGFGLRYDISPKLRARADMRHVFTDGIGDFSLGHNLEVQFSAEFIPWHSIKDADGDGVEDRLDMCVMEAGPEELQGCPDSDNDGLLDKDDRCPNAAGPKEQRGCPDTDGDKLLDPDDSCPDKAGPIKLGGCPMPDSDKDGLLDNEDMCPEVAEDVDGFQDDDGCPDLDNDQDTIADVDDECPDIPESMNGVHDRDGCPETDQDNDGIVDGSDLCKDQEETINEFEDTDGCPDEVPQEVLDMDGIIDGITFAGKADAPVIATHSYVKVDSLIALMKKHPSLRYNITVHTGTDGDDQDNYFLSERQAEVLRQYMLSKGVKSEHAQTKGSGEVPEDATADQKKHGYLILERF